MGSSEFIEVFAATHNIQKLINRNINMFSAESTNTPMT